MKKPSFTYDSSRYKSFIPDEIIEILTTHFWVDKCDITPDTRFPEDLGADSLDVVEIAIDIEQEYDISLSDDKLERCYTVGDLVELVNELKKEKNCVHFINGCRVYD